MENSFSPPTAARFRVLIVDDHPNTAATLARSLASLGPDIEIIAAESGEAALKLVQGRGVDILITDMVMPGMNGLELMERLQSHPAGRPLFNVLITAFDVSNLKDTGRHLRIDEIIVKPVRPERICQFVARAVKELKYALPPQAIGGKPSFKILIADDISDNVVLLKRYLENEGYVCLTAADGNQVLAKMRSEQPDLVLLDVNMPLKDGFETLHEIRADSLIAHIPVFILTAARLDPRDIHMALNMGADDYITKPFDRRELLARIRTRLRIKEAEDLLRRRNRELSLLPEIGRELSARLDVGELTDVILRRTVETLGAPFGHLSILVTQPPLHKSYRFSSAAELQAKIPESFLNEILDQVRQSRQGFLLDDVRQDTRWQAPAENSIRSMIAIPMLGRFDLLGVLFLAHEQTGYFDIEHKLLLQAIASQAAIALENAYLYASTTEYPYRNGFLLQGPIYAVLAFDENDRLLWMNRSGAGLFTDPAIAPGKTLPTAGQYVALVELLNQGHASEKNASAEIVWPDGRRFSALRMPLGENETLLLLQDASSPCQASGPAPVGIG